MRETCDHSLANSWALCDEALGVGNCDVAMQRRFSRSSWRWMDAYEKGLKGALAAWAVKMCSKHRGLSHAVEVKMNAIAADESAAAAVEAAVLAAAAAPAPLL